MSEVPTFNPEEEGAETLPKYGCNVRVKNYWNRHAQKLSGEVVAGGELSKSSISERGAAQAREFGANIEASAQGAKAYVSNSSRTRETVESILEGYQAKNPDAPIKTIRVKDELSPNYPKDFLGQYDDKFVESRTKIMQEMGLDPKTFKELTPDQQEDIAEKAEEPVMQEWLSGEGELAKLFTTEDAARAFAQLFSRRSGRMASKLSSGSEIDLFHVTHKGIAEPFLTSGVLIDSNGQKVTDIEQLGGSLAILEGFESETSTDAEGGTTTKVTLRDESYSVDEALLEQLAKNKKE